MKKTQEQRVESLEALTGLTPRVVAVENRAEISAFLASPASRGRASEDFMLIITGVPRRED